jgi:prepilin-type N-terminal cleavage/methylation domain-containing protein
MTQGMIAMKKNRPDPHGFTLVEIIVVLLLVSILAATTGLLLTTSIRSYTLVRQSAEISQKAQLALDRMRLELTNISDVHSAGPTSLYYRIKPEGQAETTRVLGLETDRVTLGTAWPPAGGHTLVDQVGAFTLAFFDENGDLSGLSNWTAPGSWNSVGVTGLYAIRITLSLSHDAGDFIVTSVVYPNFRSRRNAGASGWNRQ